MLPLTLEEADMLIIYGSPQEFAKVNESLGFKGCSFLCPVTVQRAHRKATPTSQRGLRSLRSNPPVLHRKENNIHRINRLPLRSSGITSVDVVGTGPRRGLGGTVFSKVRNLGYRTRLAVKTE
jgi:hypothetical protein